MAKTSKKAAAARARAGRAKARSALPPSSLSTPLKSSSKLLTRVLVTANNEEDRITDVTVISDSESDLEMDFECGYEGGVENPGSETEYEPEEVDEEWSEEELIEVGEEDLPPILPVESLQVFLGQKTSKEWEEAEKNRKLGYTGTSTRTKQRKAKEAREREEIRKQAKVS